ncbi:hypothetical protein BS78_02G308500 [Paspalum vaginatum]|nr:hypothetical protein BS78_02G308500 [Paspalum vaginatum]
MNQFRPPASASTTQPTLSTSQPAPSSAGKAAVPVSPAAASFFPARSFAGRSKHLRWSDDYPSDDESPPASYRDALLGVRPDPVATQGQEVAPVTSSVVAAADPAEPSRRRPRRHRRGKRRSRRKARRAGADASSDDAHLSGYDGGRADGICSGGQCHLPP